MLLWIIVVVDNCIVFVVHVVSICIVVVHAVDNCIVVDNLLIFVVNYMN